MTKRDAFLTNDRAHRRELPALLQAHLGKWVAYRRGRRIRQVYDSHADAVRASIDAGVAIDDLFVRLIIEEPEPRFYSVSA